LDAWYGGTAGCAQRRDRVLGAKEHAFYVDGLHPIPLGLGEFMGRLVRPGDAGVVDEDVQTSERGHGGGDRRRHVRFHRDVGVEVARVIAEPRGQLLSRPVVQVDDGHPGTSFQQTAHASGADAYGSAGHQRHFSAQSAHDMPPQRIEP
jgi:hypothetical protein